MQRLVPLLALLALASCGTPERQPAGPRDEPRLLASAWLQGEPVAFSELAGSVVIVDFWASWYPASREVVQLLKDLAARYSDRGLVILSCTQEDPLIVEPLIRRLGVPYPVFVDLDGQTAALFAVETVPTVLVYGRDGRTVYRGHPLRAGFSEKVRGAVGGRAGL